LGVSNIRFKDIYLSVKLTNDGSGGISVDTSGNVGIGTTSPSAPLDLISNSGTVGAYIRGRSSDNTGSVYFTSNANTATEYGFIQGRSTDLRIQGFNNGLILQPNSGNVGIGTSSSDSLLDVRGADESQIKMTGASGVEAVMRASASTVTFGSNTSHNLYLRTGNSARMTIDTSGNVGIGTTSPNVNHKLTIVDTTGNGGGTLGLNVSSSGTSDNLGRLHFGNATDRVLAAIFGIADGASDAGALTFRTEKTGETLEERMRIDSSGNLLVGVSTFANNTLGVAMRGASTGASDESVRCAVPSTSSTLQIGFYNANGRVGSVSTSGTSTAFNTSSDYRLKENVNYDFTALDRVAQLKPARFNFITDADTTVDGFLAHEVQDIVPEAIHGEKDAVDDEGNPEYQGIDQSKLVPLLTKAIQEQQTIIDDLKSRIEALEG